MTPTTTTPQWLLQSEPGLCQCGPSGRRKKGTFVERTLRSGTGVLQRALASDDIASGPGLLQRVDARVKLIAILGTVVAAALVHHAVVLVALYLATLPLAAASNLPLRFFVKRVWLFVPIFTGIVVLPATLNIVTPGDVVVGLGTWFGHPVGLTEQGLTSAGLIIARVATSISLVVLLTLTTPWHQVLKALRSIHVPKMFVMITGMTYRFIFVLLGSVTDMFTARRARMIGRERHNAGARSFVSASAGALFGKAHVLADDVHMAMVARGYDGEPRSLSTMRVGWIDLYVAIGFAVAALTVLGVDHVLTTG